MGIWADRFYSLRNSIIHGNSVPDSKYVYRGVQHHLMIAPMFFVVVVRRLARNALRGKAPTPDFFDRIEWVNPRVDEDGEEVEGGFRMATDWADLIEAQHPNLLT